MKVHVLPYFLNRGLYITIFFKKIKRMRKMLKCTALIFFFFLRFTETGKLLETFEVQFNITDGVIYFE